MSTQNGRSAPVNSASEQFPDAGPQSHQESLGDLTPLNYNCPLLVHANGAHPDVENRLSAAILFNYTIDTVWFYIFGYHRALPGFRSYDIMLLAEPVANEIMDIIKSIPFKCQEYPDPETRFKALLSLCMIGEIILRVGSTELGRQVRGYFDGISVLERAMLDVVHLMTLEEKAAIRDGEDQDNEQQVLPKLQMLREEGRWCLFYDNMHWVIDALQDPSLLDDSNGDEN